MENQEFQRFVISTIVLEWKKALLGKIPYDSDDASIFMAERNLYNWLIHPDMKGNQLFVEYLYIHMRDVFPYSGNVYRGMRMEKNATLYPRSAASFTSERAIANKFAGVGEHEEDFKDEKTPLVIETEVVDAFAFDELAKSILERTENADLSFALEDFIEEHEKILPMSKELIGHY